MANPYDQFDATAAPVANPYDQFDAHPAPPQAHPPEQAGGGISAQVVKGIPVVGGLAQKGAAATNAALDPVVGAIRHWRGAPELPGTQGTYGERYARHLDELRAADAATEREHPVGSAALQAAGGLGAFGGGARLTGSPVMTTSWPGMAPTSARIATAAYTPPVGAAVLGGATGGLGRRMATSGAANAVLGGADAATRDQDIGTGAATSGAFGVAGPLVGRMVGGLTNKVTGTTRAAVPPTAQELIDEAKRGYNAARGTGLELHGQAASDLSHRLEQNILPNVRPMQAPQTFDILHSLQNPPPGGAVDATAIMAARSQLGNAARNHLNPTEKVAAGPSIEGLENYLSNVPAADVKKGDAGAFNSYYAPARQNYAAGKRAERAAEVTRHAETSAASTGSGNNTNNKERQGWNQVLRQDALKGNTGLNEAELAQADKVVRGTKFGNAMRRTGNFLGAGGGLGRLVAVGAGGNMGEHLTRHAGASGVGAGVGTAIGGPVGAGIGAALPIAAGWGARSLAERSTQKGLNTLDEMIRRRAPASAPANAAQARAGATNNTAMQGGAFASRAAGTPIAQLFQQTLGANQ